MLIFGHKFFGHNSAIFGQWPIEVKFFIGAQKTIICYWSWEIQVLIFVFPFFATFGREMGGATTRTPNNLIIWGAQTQPNIWPDGWTFGVNCYLRIIFYKSSRAKKSLLLLKATKQRVNNVCMNKVIYCFWRRLLDRWVHGIVLFRRDKLVKLTIQNGGTNWYL